MFALLAGCSTGGQRLTRSGFLADYAQLERPAAVKEAAIWVSSEYRPSAYQRVAIAPVAWLAPQREPAVQKMLQGALRDRLTAAFRDRYQIIDTGRSDTGTLRIRSAITGTRRTPP